MKARHLCNSLAAIANLSTACTSLRLLCCRQMKRWWTQIRTAVNNEKVNGRYLDGIPFSNCVRLASSVGAGFRTTTIRQAGPRKRTLESDIVRSLVVWPDDEERPASGSSSSVSRLVEDEAGPASYGTLSSSLWFDANPAVPDLISDDQERPASGSSSTVLRLVEDEAGPASYGSPSSSLWFDANPAVPVVIFPGSERG